jgi:L-ascorbate metabolism protein UlaG (beta-lactamase superfamily)
MRVLSKSDRENIMRWTFGIFFAAILLAASPAPAEDAPASGKVQVLWLGQSAMRITTPGGKVIQIDPFITKNPKTPAAWKDLSKLGHLDLLLVTHGHLDHVGDTFELSKTNGIEVYAPAGLEDTFITLGLLPPERAPRMNKGGTIHPLGPGIAISMVHADHSSEFLAVNPFTGKQENFPGGEPVGFILKLENGFTIYHMGDTGLFGDMKLIADLYHPDLVMIPIGGHYVMDPEAAAYALKNYLKPRYAIPMHYGTTPLLAGTPEQLIEAMGRDSATKIVVMQPGDSTSF